MARREMAVNACRNTDACRLELFAIMLYQNCLWSIGLLQCYALTTVVCTRLRIVSGVFTRFLRKYLHIPNLPLVQIVRLVIQAVVALKGQQQIPVREKVSW